MRKLIAAINITIDGYCDHTHGIPDAELHNHYTQLLNNAGSIIYGRVTYQLMESFWPALVKSPTGEKSMDDFAMAIDNVPKIVFSNTLKNLGWKTARLAKGSPEEEVAELKSQYGKDIYVGSPGLISALTNLNLIDEYQLCVHPVIGGGGLPLFKQSNRAVLTLLKTKTFGSGCVLHHYAPAKS